MTTVYLIKFCAVIVSVCIADICWTYYFIKVADRKPVAAGIWSCLITACGAFTVQEYVTDRSLIWAAIIGGFIGAYVSVEYKRRKEAKKDKENGQS